MFLSWRFTASLSFLFHKGQQKRYIPLHILFFIHCTHVPFAFPFICSSSTRGPQIFQNNPTDKKAPDRTDTCADSWVASCLHYYLWKGTKWQRYHCICWETPTYPGGCLLRSRVLGAHHHFPPLSPPWAVQVHGPCPVAPTTWWCFSAENQETCKTKSSPNLFRKNVSEHFILQLRPTLRTASIMITITTWNRCVSKVSIPLFLFCELVFARVVLDFFNCSIITCISNISNIVTEAANIC